MRRLNAFLTFILYAVSCCAVFGQVNVLTYHDNNARDGQNLSEKLLTPANVNSSSFGKILSYSVDGFVYAQPLYVSGLTIPGKGARNVVFVATEHNSVYALDGDSKLGATSGVLWQVNLGPSAATPTSDFGNRNGSFTAIVPEVGITGTPVIDLASKTIYVDAFTHEGSSYFHKMHALDLTTGAERAFSPVTVSASVPGVGVASSGGVVSFEPKQHIHRAALTLADGVLYAAYAGYEDTDPYHGWIIGFNPANLQQLPAYTFNTTPNSTVAAFGAHAGEGGIWMAGCGLSADSSGNLFVVSGNGSFNALNGSGGTEYGETFLRLSTSGGLAVADYFTPYNQGFLSDNDLDVGSGGLLLLPDQPGTHPHLMLGGGKQDRLYLINRDMMTTGNNHYNSGGSSDAIVQTVALGGGIFATPAYFNGHIYVAASGDVLAAFTLSGGLLSSGATSVSTRRFPYPGATPTVSANGTSNGIVWALQMGSPGVLAAYDATDLMAEIYNSTQAGSRDALPNGAKFAVPIVANGKVYTGGQGAVSVFGLLGGPYNIWKSFHFGSNAGNPAIAGNQADPDADGLVNLWEYALGSDPLRADANRRMSGAIVSSHFQLQLSRNLAATDLTYQVQRALQITGPWSNVATYTASAGWVTNTTGIVISESAATGAPPDQYVQAMITEQTPASSLAFFRMVLTQTP
jgi:hypothetical protein